MRLDEAGRSDCRPRGSIPAVTFVRDDEVKSVDGDIKLLGVIVNPFVAVPKMASRPKRLMVIRCPRAESAGYRVDTPYQT
jgi:hypothetical protein